MNRQRAGAAAERDVHRLRTDARPLSAATALRTRELAAYWMDVDCRASLHKDAPPEAWMALAREYQATQFSAWLHWPPRKTPEGFNILKEPAHA